jgi:hypothetical protein
MEISYLIDSKKRKNKLQFSNMVIRNIPQLNLLLEVPKECDYIQYNAVESQMEYTIKPECFFNVFDFYYDHSEIDVVKQHFVYDTKTHSLKKALDKLHAHIYYVNTNKVIDRIQLKMEEDATYVFTWFFYLKFNTKKIKKLTRKQVERLSYPLSVQQHSIIEHNSEYYRVTSVPKVYNLFADCQEISAMNDTALALARPDDILVDSSKYEAKMLELQNFELHMIYDVETIPVQGKHLVYMLYAEIFIPGVDKVLDTIKYTCVNFEECHNNKCFDHLFQQIADIVMTGRIIKNGVKKIWLIGFNNFRFDDSFLRTWAMENMEWVEFSERKNSPNSTSVKLKNIGTELITFDLIKWCPGMSLAAASKSYKLPLEKVGFDIVKFGRHILDHCQTLNEVLIEKNQLTKFFKSHPEEYRINSWLVVKDGVDYVDLMKACEFYCEADVYVTLLLFNKIYNSMKDIINYFNDQFYLDSFKPNTKKIIGSMLYLSTPSSTAIELQMRINKHNNNYFYKINNPIYKDLCDRAYYGGRTDFSHIGYIDEPVVYYDVCGMYSLAMKAPYPASPPLSLMFTKYLRNGAEKELAKVKIRRLYDLFKVTCDTIYTKRLNLPDMNEQEEFALFDKHAGILLCNIYPPHELMLLPSAPVGYKSLDKTSTLFNNRPQLNIVLTSVHIRTLLYCHYKVEVLDYCNNVFFEDMSPILKEYNEILTKKKTEYQLQGNTSGRSLMKLFLNSLYGKLAQNTHAKTMSYQQEQAIEIDAMEDMTEYVKDTENMNSYLYLGAFVTSYSNYVLMTSMYAACFPYLGLDNELKQKVWYYCDTDSLMLNKRLAYNFNPTIGVQCGNYNLDSRQFEAVWETEDYDGMVIFGKKSYALIKAGVLVEKKFKGLPATALDKLTYNSIIAKFSPIRNLLCNKEVVVMENRLIRKRKSMPGKVGVVTSYLEETLSRTLRVNNRLHTYLNKLTRNQLSLCVDKYDKYKVSQHAKKQGIENLTFFFETGICKSCGKEVESTFSLYSYQCYDCEEKSFL